MNSARISAGAVTMLALFAAANANADTQNVGGAAAGGQTIVLNTFNQVLPQLIGDNLGPMQNGVPRVGKNTGVGYMDSQLKIDDSPSAKANYATTVPLLITTTRTDNQAVNGGNAPSYMQGAFSVVNLTANGPQLSTMKTVNLPRLNGERNWQKPNIVATDHNYLLVAASEDNGITNNPQVVAFVYDKQTLQPVPVNNSNREDSTREPTNLIELSGRNDAQQYGPHSVQRLGPNSFVFGVQRNNQNAYVMRVTVDENGGNGGGVNLNVDYLKRVVQNARHCRPDIAPIPDGATTGYMTSVEANQQPANIGVRALSFDVNTGEVIDSKLIAESDPENNLYAVQPNIADLGDHLAVSYQMSTKTRRGDNNGHTGGSNQSMLALLDKSTLQPVGAPMASVAPYSRHAAAVSTMWGEDGKTTPAVVSLGGSATGTGKGLAQIIPFDKSTSAFGAKDPQKLYELSQFSDIAGTVTRGKRNPNNQGRGFIYALGNIPNPGYGKGSNAFMPEVKSFVGSAVQGYTNTNTAKIAARESIWLSLVPATWQAGAKTIPGIATPTPGINPDGSGPLPRVNAPWTNTDPQASTPGGGGSPDPSGQGLRGGSHSEADGGCSISTHATTGAGSGGLLVVAVGALLAFRRRAERE